MMVFALPLLLLYNGRRGNDTYRQWFFYVLSPTLWVLYIGCGVQR